MDDVDQQDVWLRFLQMVVVFFRFFMFLHILSLSINQCGYKPYQTSRLVPELVGLTNLSPYIVIVKSILVNVYAVHILSQF